MNKFEELNYDQLEELSVMGGNDSGSAIAPNSALTSLAAWTAVISAISTVTGVSVGFSALYSCSKNKAACDRG